MCGHNTVVPGLLGVTYSLSYSIFSDFEEIDGPLALRLEKLFLFLSVVFLKQGLALQPG